MTTIYKSYLAATITVRLENDPDADRAVIKDELDEEDQRLEDILDGIDGRQDVLQERLDREPENAVAIIAEIATEGAREERARLELAEINELQRKLAAA